MPVLITTFFLMLFSHTYVEVHFLHWSFATTNAFTITMKDMFFYYFYFLFAKKKRKKEWLVLGDVPHKQNMMLKCYQQKAITSENVVCEAQFNFFYFIEKPCSVLVTFNFSNFEPFRLLQRLWHHEKYYQTE